MKASLLIVYPGSLYPKVMASQDRVVTMIRRLSMDHAVDLAFLYRNQQELDLSQEKLAGHVNRLFPVPASNPTWSPIRRAYWRTLYLLSHFFLHTASDSFYGSQPRFLRRVRRIIRRGTYQVVQLEYWHAWRLFKTIGGNVIKAIDAHDILYEKKVQALLRASSGRLGPFNRRLLQKYERLEKRAYRMADVLISISEHDLSVAKTINPSARHILVPAGQELDAYSDFPACPDHTVLFYGSMGAKENVDAFFRFYDAIYPLVLKNVPDMKVLVVGSSPPKEILRLGERPNVIITGFVPDVRPYLAQSSVMVLPLNVAGGFRCRTVEVMAMGVPVVGTVAALRSIGMANGKQGFISDVDSELADFTVRILTDRRLHEEMSRSCRSFVAANFSAELTYGKLSSFYDAITRGC